MLVDELDRILHGHDVLVALVVDLVDHGGQRGRLARAGGTGDQHQPAWLVAELLDDLGQPQLVERSNLERDSSEHPGHVPLLQEHVAAEARQTLHAEREIQLLILFQPRLLLVGED